MRCRSRLSHLTTAVAAARALAEGRSLLAPDLGTHREARLASQNQPLDDTTEEAIAEDGVDIAERTRGDEGPGVQLKQANTFDDDGLGERDAMIFEKINAQQLKDRTFVRRAILSEKNPETVNKLLDSYCVGVGGGGATTGKKKRVRPPKQAAIQVLTAAFRRFPRLGSLDGSGNSTHVVLRGWPSSGQDKRLFHNELL